MQFINHTHQLMLGGITEKEQQLLKDASYWIWSHSNCGLTQAQAGLLCRDYANKNGYESTAEELGKNALEEFVKESFHNRLPSLVDDLEEAEKENEKTA